jgi:adenylate kinase
VQLAATEYLCPIDKAILLDLDDQTAISRLGGRSECGKCGILYGANRSPKTAGVCDECSQPLKVRSDDQDVEAIKTRLAAYHNEIDNLVRYYEWKGVLKTINAGGTVDEVFAKVIAALKA